MALYLIDEGRENIALKLIEKDGEAKVVLIQNGVFLDPNQFKDAGAEVFAIKVDVEKRGLNEKIPEFVRLIDYSTLVDLIFENKKIVNLA